MDKRPRRFIVPIFIPNLGCPHRCIFCDQRRITGQKRISPEKVKDIIETALRSERYEKEKGIEVAFYGGTFTGLPLSYMKELLSSVKPYMEKEIVKEIRVSTRPDKVNEEILRFIKDYGVRTVELGAQSLDDNVLELSKRGHSSEDTIRAFYLLKDLGFKVGIQLMPGLPGDSREKFLKTIEKVIALKPDMVRLYPTVVIKGSELERLYKEGRYFPLSLEEAVEICAESCILLEKEGIPVIRIGLMYSDELVRNIVAGPWHPSFGFLVRSKIYIRQYVLPVLRGIKEKEVDLFCHPKKLTLIKGYKKEGLRFIEEKTGIKIRKVIPKEDIEEVKPIFQE